MRLTHLADWLRADGLSVVEHPGWLERGRDLKALPSVVVGHHTATSAKAPGDLPTLRLLVEGRSDLPGPLCQLGLSRSGVYHVIASGKANHAGKGAWRGVTDSSRTIGIEAEYPGTGLWPDAQLDAFDRGVACLLRNLGQPASMYCGHREWALPAGRKVDPGRIDLTAQRWRVAALLDRTSGTSQPEELDMDETTLRRIVSEEVDRAVLQLSGGPRKRDAEGKVIDSDPGHVSTADVLTKIERVADYLVSKLGKP